MKPWPLCDSRAAGALPTRVQFLRGLPMNALLRCLEELLLYLNLSISSLWEETRIYPMMILKACETR